MTRENHTTWSLDLGANLINHNTVHFKVWAPLADAMSVRIHSSTPDRYSLTPTETGYWEGTVSPLPADTLYRFIINQNLERPDPASRFQPNGVHEPSVIVDPSTFTWRDHDWKGLSLESLIIYELHVGTFTPKGTFEAIIDKLPYLRDTLGITAIELMPVAQCPGVRNWGYDGTYLFAPQANYGGPEGLKRLVDACHAQGLAVIMDVVYNHLGPEGNYLGEYGPYFTHRYPTPWGQAINYDGPQSDPVRHFIISNALYWVTEYHIDALRLDAIHGIFDFSAKHVLQELGEAVHEQAKHLGRTIHVIAESDLNDSPVINPLKKGGYGLDSQWSDDFHHTLHCVLTGEQNGYYEDFGKLQQLATAMKDRFVYSGQYSSHRQRCHGNSAKQASPTQFVVFSQNHDQVGNRALGDRLSTLVAWDALKPAAAAVLLSPNIPLLFMGEEYGERAPFLYFIDHGDPGLVEAVRQGRKAEFASFGWTDVPDPYAQTTFDQSRLQWKDERTGEQHCLLNWYQTLITLRKSIPSLGAGHKKDTFRIWTNAKAKVLTICRTAQSSPDALILLSFNKKETTIALNQPEGQWHLRLDSGSESFQVKPNFLAPQDLTIPLSLPSLQLPPYGVWVYTK